jgi:hypothetical protein
MKALKNQILEGPNKEQVKVSWMPGNRLRIDFPDSGPCVVKLLFTSKRTSHLELAYGTREEQK